MGTVHDSLAGMEAVLGLWHYIPHDILLFVLISSIT